MIKTFDLANFQPLDKTAALKKKGNIKVSAILPSRNEAETIGGIIESIKIFSDGNNLVDEIIVMDCFSTDTTVAVARGAGATVHDLSAIRPEINATGKGVAMWKSQFVASGDILLFLDADIRNFNERFIIGLVGALLEDTDLQLVKAAYRRPLITEDLKIEDSGGRVTELFIRPLLNLFIPELGYIRQPLAGEYAFRKTAIGKLDFYSGYGVDIGLLLEQYFLDGLQSIGQVELGEREHRNRNISELSKMAFEIGGVFFSLLSRYNICQLNGECNPYFKVWEASEWHSYHLENQLLPSMDGVTAG